MKRVLILIVFLLLFGSKAFAVDFLPRYSDNIKNYGIGIYFGDGQATIYKEPSDKSQIIAKMTWTANQVLINNTAIEPQNVFCVFLPKNALSGFIAVDEQTDEYVKVIYDMRNQSEGWIKHSPDNKMYYWRQLFYKYGKTKGIYIFADIPKESRILKMQPDIDSDISYEIFYPKYIRLQLVKGNWALLKVVDFSDEQKVGWYQWRNSDGTLNAFPQFNGD